jgi:hypothetical protein
MRRSFRGSTGAALVGGIVSLVIAHAGAQTAAKAAPSRGQAYTAPRTVDGQPDLQGTWSYGTLTPLVRPAGLGEFLTPAEVAEAERKAAAAATDEARGADRVSDVNDAYNDFWWDKGTKVVGNRRTSLITDPPDGRLPAISPAGQKRLQRQAAGQSRDGRTENPEERSLGERCIIFTNRSGPPMTPSAYNNNFEVVQSKDAVAITNEQSHDTRVIPLDGRPHLPAVIRQWAGDGRAHFEGDTLVIETTNFTAKTQFQGSSENMVLIERFTRVGPKALNYEFTVSDPETFAKSWTAQNLLTPTNGSLYEYACHEGNYAMLGILNGARAQERRAAASKPESK